ncbi:MAG: hypothetical protein IKT98_06330 [Selenomonadaceae bacterium]|nr:hypothetical protein [Selenomonadaceae bacterium]
MTGDIRNDVGATLNISAKGGSIIQEEGVKVSTDNINLSARNDIKNINIVNRRTDDLKLNAQTTAGDIDVNVTGGISGNKNLAGNVTVNALNSKEGNVTLTAQGDIKQTIKDTSINARNIKLESANGSINLQIESNGQANTADKSAISAAANGNIKLAKNDNDDFLIGSIVSTTGDVELKANGRFVDALDKVRDNSDMQESDLVKSWIDMGLIAGTDDYKGAYIHRLEQDRDNYKADVTAQFAEYQTLLTNYNTTHEQNSELEKGDRLILLEKKFAKYKTADEYLAADSDYQTLVSTVANPQYKWTQEELFSAIRSSIVNKEEGTAYDVTRLKDANITARNVTLTGAGVGTNSKETATIKMSELRVKANETDKEKSARLEKLSALANVEAADVKVNYALDANGKPVAQTVTQVNYRYDADKGYYIDKAGIFNANGNGANVVAKDLVLVGGNDAIGTQAKPFAVTLTGDLLNARSNKEINLSKVGKDNFRISAIYSPKAIRITNDGNGIIEHSTRFDGIAAAYINTPGEITLTGSAGTANNPILIKPSETTTLNLRGDNEFYIKGLNSGTVNLNDISGKVDSAPTVR